MQKPRIAVIGAGLGGATCAALFQQAGYPVDVYEQAPVFTRLGAGIHLGPNCVRVLNHLGLERRLLEIGVRPKAWNSLMWDTGEPLFSLPLKGVAEELYGAAYLTMHRGDLHHDFRTIPLLLDHLFQTAYLSGDCS